MSHQISLYVVTESEGAEGLLADIVSRWEDKYGGVTVLGGEGHWGGLTESVTVVQTLCMKNPLDRDDLQEVQERIITEIGEDSVLASIDDVEPIMLTESDVSADEEPEQVRAD